MAMIVWIAAFSEDSRIFIVRPGWIEKPVRSVEMFFSRNLYLHSVKVNRIKLKRFLKREISGNRAV
jgi:hypothetical protein